MSNNPNALYKLVSINLVNWYLFDNVAIKMNGNSLLIRGTNGSGKSSILDAMQTIFAGGDETLLMMNAASSDGRRSGRTIRSYVLGEVAESPGQKACEPRKASNTYICLNFVDKQGKPFCFGMGFYAKASESKSLQKHMFLVDGNCLTEMDFIKDEFTVLPWPAFEQRLKAMKGKLTLAQTAKEFRELYCDMMSAPGAENYIPPDMLFRSIRNGLTFKEQKDISEFTRKFILPENNIDVVRIENDYQEYRRIQEIIQDAKNRLSALNDIIKLFENYKAKEALSIGYKWAYCEAKVCGLDSRICNATDEAENLEENIKAWTKDLVNELDRSISLGKARDNALLAKESSAGQQAIEQCRTSIKTEQMNIDGLENELKKTRKQLLEIINLSVPDFGTGTLTARYQSIQQSLKRHIGFGDDRIIQPWPLDINNIQDTIDCLQSFMAAQDDLDELHDEVKANYDGLKKDFDQLTLTIKSARAGKATLMDTTTAMIELLGRHGIEAKPICDLAEITDTDWQEAIERYLGNNRESLVITKGDFSQAIAVYRKEKAQNEKLRSAKLVNPDKVFGSTEAPANDYAGALVRSENETALRYLRGLLNKVRLVETEAELRKEQRAISKDGMVAANGTISGGNRFQWILIGQEARKSHAEMLALNMEKLAPVMQEQYSIYRKVADFKKTLDSAISTLIASSETAKIQYNQITLAEETKKKDQHRLNELEKNADLSLEKTFDQADAALKKCHDKIADLKIEISGAQKTMNELTGEYGTIKSLERDLVRVAEQRKETESIQGFDPAVAQANYEKLTQEFPDQYDNVASIALIRHEKNSKSSLQAREEGIRANTAFCQNFDIDDKEELVVMHPLDALVRCREHADRIVSAEILVYESDAEEARDKMLRNFRSEVVAKLKECFTKIDITFKDLNHTLKELPFNGNVFRFLWPLVEVETLKLVHNYVVDTSDLELEAVGTMFDEHTEHPAVKVIQEILEDGRLKEISDYRNFYSYDIVSKNKETHTERRFSELLSKGSGGEQQAPLYVALGASFMSTYRLRKAGDKVFGGAAIAIFDEAFSKMDGGNSQAALQFFNDIGLQVILAAPPESEIKVGPYVDQIISIIRGGDVIHLDYKAYTETARELLDSDNPHKHPEIISEYL